MADSSKEVPGTPIVTETQSIESMDRIVEKKVVWKCDLYVVPILSFLMCLGFLDRINIGNARLQGLEKDLGMSGHDFNIALFIFFIPYMVCEVPSNIILKKVAPSTWLSCVMMGWGEWLPHAVSYCFNYSNGIYRARHGLPRGYG